MRLWVITAILAGSLAAQDHQDKAVELKVKVGKRPANGVGIPGYNFELKPAITVEGKPATAASLRTALEKALEYILSQQEKDGAWSIKDAQLSDLGRKSGFRNTGRDSTSRVVLTSLTCMALRAHQELAPRRIKEAVAKGLDFVIENAPKHNKDRYGIWTWSFCIEFLTDEYRCAKEGDVRNRIKESVQKTADRLIQNQHKGIKTVKEWKRPDPERPVPEYKDEVARRQASAKDANSGGYLGITPGQDGGEDDEGLIVQEVAPNGPAQKAGLKAGDRILEINGVKIKTGDQLVQVAKTLKADAEIVIKIVRDGAKSEQYPVDPQDKPRQAGPVPDDGGWSYYNMGAMSFATATAVISLIDAKAIGCEIPQAVIDRGTALLEASRLHGKGNEDGFGYRAGPSGDLRGSVGRVCSCEMAMLMAGKSDLKFMERAIKVFVNMRQELDLVLGYPGNHVRFSFSNAAYYFLYAHYYSARSLHALKDPEKEKKYGAFIQEALLQHQLPAGTWHDHESWGQLYGTAMALVALGQLKMVTPDAYAEVIKSVDSKGEEY